VNQLGFNFEAYEEAVLNPLAGHDLDELESYIASLLLEASAEKPMNSDYIIRAVADALDRKIAVRNVKTVVRTLRKVHGFPILARRTKPTGYWWCGSLEEMQEFVELFKAQALDELHTLSRIVKNNYPKLAGQLTLKDAVLLVTDGEFEN
jgi:hypothetical protein